MTYKQRLIEFNKTDKYRSELQFVTKLIGRDDKVLDYGCGIGTAVKHFKYHTQSRVYGYDVTNFLDEDELWFLDQPPRDSYHHITFIHSIAHIENIFYTLVKLRDNLVIGGKITVVTPNQEWINYVGDTKSDPTVVQHYTPKTLSDLFTHTGYRINQLGQFGEYKGGFNERIFIQVCRDSSL